MTKPRSKWRIFLALGLTVLWVGGISAGVHYLGLDVWKMEPNEWGDFLAGVGAPLALLWIIVGYFQHGKEIELQQEELRRQVEETAHLVKQSERHAGATEELVQVTRAAQEAETLRQLNEVSPKFEHSGGGGSASMVKVSIRNIGGEANGVKVHCDQEMPRVDLQFAQTIGRGVDSVVMVHGKPVGPDPTPIRFSLRCVDRLGYEHFFILELELRLNDRPIVRTITHAVFEHSHEAVINQDGTTTYEPRSRVIPLPKSFSN